MPVEEGQGQGLSKEVQGRSELLSRSEIPERRDASKEVEGHIAFWKPRTC